MDFSIPREPTEVENQVLDAAAVIASCGETYGQAIEDEARAEANVRAEESMYRAWQAKFILDAVSRAEKKPSDTVLTAMYRADPAYLLHKQRIGQASVLLGVAQKQVKTAMGGYYAALKKQETLLALWRRLNQEMDAHNFTHGRIDEQNEPQKITRKPL